MAFSADKHFDSQLFNYLQTLYFHTNYFPWLLHQQHFSNNSKGRAGLLQRKCTVSSGNMRNVLRHTFGPRGFEHNSCFHSAAFVCFRRRF